MELGKWSQSKKQSGAVVSDVPFGPFVALSPDDEELVEAYGGYPVAESILPTVIPLIIAAPDLLDSLRAIMNCLASNAIEITSLSKENKNCPMTELAMAMQTAHNLLMRLKGV